MSPGIGGHISTYASCGDAVRSRLQPFLPRREPMTRSGDHDLFPGPRRAGHLRARVPRRPHRRAASAQFPPGTGARRRAVVLSASVADAGFLAVPDRLDGAGADHVDLPGAVQPLPRRPRPDERTSGHGLGFLGDGEMDEPETLGALTLASREQLDNLIWVVNCNLQRLDGPVRGNGKIIQELEAAFRGAGWNVIKVIWGSDWDPLFAADTEGLLIKRMEEAVDGEYQKYSVEPGRYIAQAFLRQLPGPAGAGQPSDRRADPQAPARRPRSARRSTRPTRPPSSTRASRPSSSPRRSRATAWAKPAKAATSRISRRS